MTETRPHRVELSEDRRHMTVTSADGRRSATMRSALPNGFTDEQAFRALTFNFSVTTPGGKTWSRMWRIGGRVLYVNVQKAPPTWWLPRVATGRATGRGLMVGWLRVMVAVIIRKEESDG